MCLDKWTLGWRVNGCMCEYVAAPEMFLHKMPDGLSFELAAMCEPMAVAVYDVAEHGKININDLWSCREAAQLVFWRPIWQNGWVHVVWCLRVLMQANIAVSA